MKTLSLYVSVPVASFRVPQAREYFETLPCPPPSTVYGMLLSLVGEPDRLRHMGAEVALALLSAPGRSVVLRTLWRVRDKKKGPGIDNNKRPDFQELLTGIKLAVWVRPGPKEEGPCLSERIEETLSRPADTRRFGGLSLGESTHLVDEVRRLRPIDGKHCRILVKDSQGDLALPVWPDHVGSKGTRWGQYRLSDSAVPDSVRDDAWTEISQPEPAA